jgi:hypothetical protein
VKLRAFAFVFLAAASVGCVHSRPSVLAIPLQVSERPDDFPAVKYSDELRLFVQPVVDEREDKAHVGANQEGDSTVPVIAGGTPPTEFVAKIVTSELSNAGVKIATDAASANRVLRLRLTRFYTTEKNLYESEVGVIAEVLDAKQRVLFSSALSGHGKQFGHSLDPDNYDEVFSRCVFDLAKNMFTQGDFQKAIDVSGTGPAARTVDGGAAI